jgi:trehalose 6-phosphate phosphatase
MNEDALNRLRSAPRRAGLFLDFDGTLSEIVERPEDARPAAGVNELLVALSEKLTIVAVVSGRSAHQLLDWLGPNVEIWGLHGAERTQGGRVVLAPEAESYLETMKLVAGEARAALNTEGMEVEDKGIMLGLHYRRAADAEAARAQVESVAQTLAGRYGLTLGEGRMVVELRPPLEFSKADVIRRRASEEKLETVSFVGDDIVDLPAFDALDELESQGTTALRVAVDSNEAPKELLDRADLVVEGPSGVVEFLRSLLD